MRVYDSHTHALWAEQGRATCHSAAVTERCHLGGTRAFMAACMRPTAAVNASRQRHLPTVDQTFPTVANHVDFTAQHYYCDLPTAQ